MTLNIIADDWPHWLGPNRDAKWSETGIVESFSESQPAIAWRVPINQGYTGPAIADGYVFLMDFLADEDEEQLVNPAGRREGLRGTERVICFDEHDGTQVWDHELKCTYTMSYPQGPRTTPSVDGDRTFTLGAMGNLMCLESKSGKELWSVDLLEQFNTKPPMWGYAAHPLVDGNRLFVTVGGKGSAVVAFDKMTGKEIWRFGTVEEIGYAPPIIYEANSTRQLIVWLDSKICSLDPETGLQNWSFDFPIGKVSRPTVNIVTPRVFDGNKLLVSNYYDGSVLLEIDADHKGTKQVWIAESGVAHRGGLNALMATPIIRDGLIFGVAGKGEMRCLAAKTGKLLWENVAPTGSRPTPFANCFLVENQNRFFLLNDRGELIIARLSDAGYEEVDRMKVIEPTGFARGRTIVWSHPAFANGHMLMRNDRELLRIDLRSIKQ